MTKQTKEKGFTIIEVVLVLAIAGLIFLIVFLALPQLQRSRRDTQRRQDAGKVIAALESYSGNNNGTYPANSTAQTDFTGNYVNDLTTPDGGTYAIDWTGATNPAENAMSIGVGSGTNCSGTALGARDTVVRAGLEEGVYCQDNR